MRVMFIPLGGKGQELALPECVPGTPEFEITSDSGSEVNATQLIDEVDESGLDKGLDQCLGLLLPLSAIHGYFNFWYPRYICYCGYHQDPCNTENFHKRYSEGRVGEFGKSKFISGMGALIASQKCCMGLLAHILGFL